MDDWLKQKFDNLSDEKKKELIEVTTLASAMTFDELVAYLGIIPMTQALFNGIADACIKQGNYTALFRLVCQYKSMANSYFGITSTEDSKSQSGQFLS